MTADSGATGSRSGCSRERSGRDAVAFWSLGAAHVTADLLRGEPVGAVPVTQEDVGCGHAAGGEGNCVQAGLVPVGMLDWCFVAQGEQVPDADRHVQQQRSKKAGAVAVLGDEVED